ncbi:MAG TPA: guanylate kinase [Acetobacteraceae bacterium]|nr:guanylate kinase [Acetobacteraceae bacterium]
MSPIARRGLCLVLSAPSGAGKTAISEALLAAEPALRRSVSVTTRKPRPNEREGVHYFFREQAAFDSMAGSGALLEWAKVLGRDSYGTPRAAVEQALSEGRDMIFDIDWQGYRQLRTALPEDVVGVFVLPPSMAVLEQRLRARAGDQPEEIARRMALAHDEISHWPEFDHVVVNHELTRAIADVTAILHAARLATARQPGLPAFIEALELGAG